MSRLDRESRRFLAWCAVLLITLAITIWFASLAPEERANLAALVEVLRFAFEAGDVCFNVLDMLLSIGGDGDGDACEGVMGACGLVGIGIWTAIVKVGEAVGIDMDGDGDLDGVDDRAEMQKEQILAEQEARRKRDERGGRN